MPTIPAVTEHFELMFYNYKFISNLDDSLTTTASSDAISERTEVLHGEQNVEILYYNLPPEQRVESMPV
jgi:hypothetical protein